MLIGDFFYFEWPQSLMTLTTTSIYFVVFVFLVFCLSRIFNSILRPYVLLLANIFFLYTFGLNHLIVVLAMAIFAYLLGILLERIHKLYLLIIGIAAVVLALGFFKYYPSESMFMPLGISFYSFKIISYLIDIYQDKVIAEYNPIYFLDYVLFFPCLTAGPIHRYSHFREEIREKKEFNYKEAKGGAFQMLLGIFEKMVFCDFVASVVNRALDNPAVVGQGALLGVLLYSFQIYLDFDAISNIAIGCARLLGFNLEKNFNSPYLAKTIKEFWNRWHISLSTWLRDYIYIPLGGNRKGVWRKYLNIMIVFLVSGIWHGSTLNFLLWGIIHGLLQIIEDFIGIFFNSFKIDEKVKKILKYPLSILGIIVNFFIVSFTWLIFKYQSFTQIQEILKRINVGGAINFELIGLTHNEVIWLVVILAIVVILDILRNYTNMIEAFNNFIFPLRWAIYVILIVSFMIFGMYGGSFEASDFIYRWF